MLNGFELHVYNRSHMYARLEKVFGLESLLFPGESPFKGTTLCTLNSPNITQVFG